MNIQKEKSAAEKTAPKKSKSPAGSGMGRFYALFSAVVLGVLVVVVSLSGLTLYQRLKANRARISALETELAQAKEAGREEKKYKEFTQTDEFIKKIAREKLGLAFEDETIFRETDGN